MPGFYLYMASNEAVSSQNIYKIGAATDLWGRIATYLTGCPPKCEPSYDLQFYRVWELVATNSDEMHDIEEEIHDRFIESRLMRNKPRDSEWFKFPSDFNPVEEVHSYLMRRGLMTKTVELSEIKRINHHNSTVLSKPYKLNQKFVKNITKRNNLLNQTQEPVISAISEFLRSDNTSKAANVISPCGSGKTRMTCSSLRDILRCVICVPSRKIQQQWVETLINVIDPKTIYCIGGGFINDSDTISSILKKNCYYCVVVYASCHLLLNHINTNIQILINDESHHLAGIVADGDDGDGKTRKLLAKAVELEIKRLSLTFTPRIVRDDSNKTVLSHDDETVFGKTIAEIKYRSLIDAGILPDYRVWMITDNENKGRGIQAKAECIANAWAATEFYRGEERHILNKLIVFAATNDEAEVIEVILREKTDDDTVILRVQSGDDLDGPISQFTSATRAIFVNCFMLGEGVDIPCADSVAITYPKQSRGQTVQMFLRAGRWYPNKSLFHILVIATEEDDLSGFEEVLYSLASIDERIVDEIEYFAKKKGEKQPESIERRDDSRGTSAEHIMIENYMSDKDAIKKCFDNVRRKFYPATNVSQIRAYCIEHSIDTSVEYGLLKPEWFPDTPNFKHSETWFDFLHPTAQKMTANDWVINIVIKNNLRLSRAYNEWLGIQPPHIRTSLPSVQHITDGYFGDNMCEFGAIVAKFGGVATGRRGR